MTRKFTARTGLSKTDASTDLTRVRLGADGLGGVEGLPDSESPEVANWFAKGADGAHIRALDGMARAVRRTWDKGKGSKVSVISSGPMTNIALFVAVYPELLDAVEEFVCSLPNFLSFELPDTLF
jgi:inosine-uridine nucleoside N-ribohydrolase